MNLSAQIKRSQAPASRQQYAKALNQALKKAIAESSPGTKRGKRTPKFYYATQVSTQPPTIVLFVNGSGLVKRDYERYLLNRFRETLPFGEIPIRLILKPRREQTPVE